MSGPKSASVSVSQAALEAARRRREEEQACAAQRQRLRRLKERIKALSAEAAEFERQWRESSREHPDIFPAGTEEEQLRARRDRVEAQAARAGRRRGPSGRMRSDNDAVEAAVADLAAAVAQARTEHAQKSALVGLHTSLQATAEAAAKSEEESRAEARARVAEKIDRLLDTLAAEASEAERTAIAARAGEAVGATPGRRTALLAQIALDVQRANAAVEARQQVVRRVEAWREKLLGLGGAEVEELDSALRQVLDDQAALPPDMEQRVAGVVARATAALERDYALEVVVQELQNLGYVVETGFETASREAPQTLLRSPGLDDGYLVSLSAGSGSLNARVVREADAGSEAEAARSAARRRMDREAETAWCGDFAAALAAAGNRGVSARLTSRSRAGEVPVQTIAPRRATGKPSRRRKRKRSRQPLARHMR